MVMWVPAPDLVSAAYLAPPPWACAWGDDAHGVFADWAWGRATQRMRWIAPGRFLMGSTSAEQSKLPKVVRAWTFPESPQHEVRLTRGYWLADTPCTQGLWEAVMGDWPTDFRRFKDESNVPADNVSWDQVQGFLAALQKRLPVGWQAGLPTEAQWEYAARAGTQTAYWWGDEPDSARANWGRERKGTTPVHRYEPNPWGLYDVHGNVWEWCQGAPRRYDTRAQVDPADVEHALERAMRGGSWRDRAGEARAAYRGGTRRGFGWDVGGFRVLLSSPSQLSRQS